MKAASLDLGSHTLRLLVAEVDGQGNWRALFRGLAHPRLGRGLRPGGRFQAQARRAAYEAAQRFVAQARELGAVKIALGATQACRLAQDGPGLAAELERELALDWVKILSGREEARLSKLGVLSRLVVPVNGAVLADVGGGSTEVTRLGDLDDPGKSLPLGAVSLTEAFLHSDPPRSDELLAMVQAVKDGLAGLDNRADRLVATAGTATTLAAILLGMTQYEAGRVNNLQASADSLSTELDRLAALTTGQRRRIPGLEPQRADIILAGLAILEGLLEHYGLDGLTVMDTGLLEGILLSALETWQQGVQG